MQRNCIKSDEKQMKQNVLWKENKKNPIIYSDDSFI